MEKESRMNQIITASEGEVFDVELEESILKANKTLAEKNRRVFLEFGIRAFDVMGSIGSGKTSLIAALIREIGSRKHVAVIEGDVTTTIDADLLAKLNVPVVPVNTGKECHLDANLVSKALAQLKLDSIEILFIENVGNLICPAEFPLGSEKRLVVISVTEGPYMVLKHPMMFLGADVVAINKIDLSSAMQVDPQRLAKDVQKINPKAQTIPVSCRQGLGIREIQKALALSDHPP